MGREITGRQQTGTQPEDLFRGLFAEVFGLEKACLLVPPHPVTDSYGNTGVLKSEIDVCGAEPRQFGHRVRLTQLGVMEAQYALAGVAVLDAELIVTGAPLGVVLPRRLVAQRFELFEDLLRRRGFGRARSGALRRRLGCRLLRQGKPR